MNVYGLESASRTIHIMFRLFQGRNRPARPSYVYPLSVSSASVLLLILRFVGAFVWVRHRIRRPSAVIGKRKWKPASRIYGHAPPNPRPRCAPASPCGINHLADARDVDTIIPHLRWMPTFRALLHFRPAMAPVCHSPEEIAGRALAHLPVIGNQNAVNETAPCRGPAANAGRCPRSRSEDQPVRRLWADAENAWTNIGVRRSPKKVM
jgi:hypothetical protein